MKSLQKKPNVIDDDDDCDEIPPIAEDKCPPNQVYVTTTKKCVDRCDASLGEKWSNIYGKCVSSCIESQVWDRETRKCRERCTDGFVWDCQLRKCVGHCKEGQVWDDESNSCRPNCNNGHWDSKTKKCVGACNKTQVWDEKTNSCRPHCFNGHWDENLKRCVGACKKTEVWDEESKACKPRCNKGSTWDEDSKKCVPSHNCKSSEVWDEESKACKPRCSATQSWNEKTKSCVTCKRHQHFDEKTHSCVNNCGKDEVWDYKYKKCKPNCKPSQVYDPKLNECASRCNHGEVWNTDDGKCETKAPKCPEGQRLNKEKDGCEDICHPPEKYNDETEECEVVCKKKGEIYNPDLKKCVPKCLTGTVYDIKNNLCHKPCTESEVYSEDKKACVSRCKKDEYYSKTNKACTPKCAQDKGLKYDETTSKCVSLCKKGQVWDLSNRNCKDKDNSKPPTDLPENPTENLCYDSQCSNRGYYIRGLCRCPTTFGGKHCEKSQTPSYFNGPGRCDDLANRLNALFNIYPGHYYGDDELFPRNQNSIGFGKGWRGNLGNGWITMHSIANGKFHIYGKQIYITDITQGAVGNCYMLAAVASLVTIQNGYYIRRAIPCNKDNSAHVYPTRWFIDGVVRIVAVDDYIPAYNGVPSNMKPNPHNTFWPFIIEKAWSKMFGSYKKTSGGLQTEVWKALTAAPGSYNSNRNWRSGNDIWNFLKTLFDAGHPVGACTLTRFSKVSAQHAFAVQGVYEVTLDNGSKVKLVFIYNPYNLTKWKANPWGDNSKVWTPTVRKQVPFDGRQDGSYFVSANDFRSIWTHTLWSYANIHSESFAFQTRFQDRQRMYSRTIKVTKSSKYPLYVYIDLQDSRVGCALFTVSYINVYLPGGKKLTARPKFGWTKDPTIKIENPKAGDYKIEMNVSNRNKYNLSFSTVLYGEIGSVNVGEVENYVTVGPKECPNHCAWRGTCNTYNGQCMCLPGYKASKSEGCAK